MEHQNVLKAFEDYEVYMESLLKTLGTSDLAHKPIAEGKWSIAQMVMHLAEWDRFIRTERLPGMAAGAQLEALPEVDAFNRRAIDKAESLEFSAIVQEALDERRALKKALATVAPEEWRAVFHVSGKELDMGRYFKGIIEHDAHHFKQIDSFLT